MEKFLEDEDRKEERKSSQPVEDEEDMIDLFDDVGDEDEAGTMYGQYFNEEDTGQDETRPNAKLHEKESDEDGGVGEVGEEGDSADGDSEDGSEDIGHEKKVNDI